MTNAEEIARGLSDRRKQFLIRVCDDLDLASANRVEDRARQFCRRMGLVYVAKNPKRWAPTPLGLEVRKLLEQFHD